MVHLRVTFFSNVPIKYKIEEWGIFGYGMCRLFFVNLFTLFGGGCRLLVGRSLVCGSFFR